MRIGIDFDNTIVSYDLLFHKVAEEGGHVPASLPKTKLAVRDHLRSIDREAIWTEMQGYVYGARLLEADAFPGLIEFMTWARNAGIALSIVSHKTRHPFIGPKYDLHAVAKDWVAQRLVDTLGRFVPEEQMFFELTKEEKLARITAGQFDYFIDDLPEILTASGFPAQTQPILFSPEGRTDAAITLSMSSWADIRTFVETQWNRSTRS